jgi:hypothetical protein
MKGASHNMAGHALYDRIHKATLMKEINRLVSIGVIEVIIIVMSLSDIYNPKEGYDSMELADLQGTQLECVNPKSTPHCRS